MYKKILALCLSVAIAMSTTIMPIFADNSIPVIRKDDGTDILSMLFKPDKKNNDKSHEVLKHFTDSDAIDWAEKSIEKLGAMGILNGMGNGLFKPNNNVTHAEAIAMVLKLTGQQAQAEAITAQPEYFRGQSAKWSWGYLQLALNEGIIIPSEDEWFNPNTPAKRHEIAKYIVRAIGKRDDALKNMNARLSFKDANAIPKSSVGYVYVINKLGIMQGSKNEFQPNKPITRAEMAVLLDRAADSFDDSIVNDNAITGVFVAYDKVNSKITLNVNNTQVVYKVNSYAPVYRNNTYYLLDTLKPGDIIEVVLDSNNTIIFVEFKEDGTVPTTGQPVSIQHLQYSSLPQALRDRIDALKLTESYAAFKQDQYIYLVASEGPMSYNGYNITMTNVYKETTSTGKYNLKAVVEKTNTSSSVTAQDAYYPYDVVRFAYFDGIEKVNFVDTANSLLRQTTINALDAIVVINGKINAVDASNRIIYLKETDNVVRPYFIPSNVQITLNGASASLASLAINMNAAINKTNGIITSVAATNNNTSEVINGTISTVDTQNRIIYVKESDNVVRPYFIPTNVRITLDNRVVSITALRENMPINLTKTNSIITEVAATSANASEVINGKINSIDATNRIIYLKESDNVVRPYFIPANVLITLDNRSAALSSLTENMDLAITKTNGIITRLDARSVSTVETINGKISSVDARNRIISVKESDNAVRTYFIPTNVQITLNNRTVAISSITENMTVVITKANGIITKLATTQTIQTITGRIDSVDVANSTVNLLENNNTINSYVILAEAQITLNNQASTLASLTQGMSATITKVDDVITRLAVQNNIENIQGVLINIYPGTNNSTINVRVGTADRQFVITPETAVFYNSQSISIAQMPINITITIKVVNGIVTEVRNR